MKILFLEPFYGGSHKDFADGLLEHSRNDITLEYLPARFWKWRMRGAALHFAERIRTPEKYDLLLTTDLISLSDLKALWGGKCPPAAVYFHENQLSYPLPPGEQMDYHFGFTDITTCLVADRLFFNSSFHMNAFFGELPRFIGKMPEYKPRWVMEPIKKKSSVAYPGCRYSLSDNRARGSGLPAAFVRRDREVPLILWNHRWEFDKNPDFFFRVLYTLAERGWDFQIALLGENFQNVPKPFLEAKDYFRERILHYGYIQDKSAYLAVLKEADIIISTSIQENFGISVLEGIYQGCFPLLPRRLSYPEIIPKQFHEECLYDSEEGLIGRLEELFKKERIIQPEGLRESAGRFDWPRRIPQFDTLFEETAGRKIHG